MQGPWGVLKVDGLTHANLGVWEVGRLGGWEARLENMHDLAYTQKRLKSI